MSQIGIRNLLIFIHIIVELFVAHGKHIPSFAGPYRLTIRIVNNETTEYNSTGRGFWLRLYSSPVRLRQPQYAWGEAFDGMDFTDDIRTEVRISKLSSNQWKRNYFVLRFERACTDMITHARFLGRLLYGSADIKCPIPKYGLRPIKNQTINAVFPQFPIMPYGRYLWTLAYIKDEETVGVYVADFDIIPKV